MQLPSIPAPSGQASSHLIANTKWNPVAGNLIQEMSRPLKITKNWIGVQKKLQSDFQGIQT